MTATFGHGMRAEGRYRRPGPVDNVIAMTSATSLRLLFWLPVLTATLYYLTPLALAPSDPGVWLLLLLPALLALAVLPLRHSRPVVASVITLACLAVSPAAIGGVIGMVGSLARRTGVGRGLPGPVGLVAAGTVVKAVQLAAGGWTSTSSVEMGISVSMLVIALFVGLLLNAVADSRDSRAEADEYRATQIRMAERARIAREMHDVVAHRVSLVAMMSGALAYREDLPADVRDAAGVIRDNSRRALDELRVVLADLRSTDDPEAPQPTLANLDDLLTEAEAAGSAVDLQPDLVPEDVPERLSRHLYRMVQEGLTNARRHAPGQEVTVRLAGSPGEGVTLRMSNPAPDPGAGEGGYGLVGIEERARLLGGTARAGRVGGTFTVDVAVPWKVG